MESARALSVTRSTVATTRALAALAASYAFGFVKNHAFVDGNKRVGFLAAYVFLAVNDYDLDAPETEVVARIDGLAAGELTERPCAA